MKDKELNILENIGKFLEIKSTDDPFKKVRVFSIIFSSLDDFLDEVKLAIRGGSIGSINGIKNRNPNQDGRFWAGLDRHDIDRLSAPEVCNYYLSTFEAIKKWGLRVIATQIKECLEEEEGICKS